MGNNLLRTRVTKIKTNLYTAGIDYEVWLNDSNGNGKSHDHEEGYHTFPMTFDELVALRDQINEILGE